MCPRLSEWLATFQARGRLPEAIKPISLSTGSGVVNLGALTSPETDG
jgi:hypothetical protein